MPFLAPVIAFIATPIGGMIASVALSVGASLIQKALAPKPPKQKDPGVSLSMQIGGNSPLSFFVGTSATAGHRVYAGTWGTDGETPNAYFVDVLELSNAPLDGLSGVYVNGEQSEIFWNEEHPEYGYPVAYGRAGSGSWIPGSGGGDHLWIKFHDGRQTSPDPYLRSKFGGSDRSYDADMVGRGNGYAIVTARYNRELWQNGRPAMLFEVRGLRLYDIRKDSTAGGSGAHRRNDPSTWEWTENPYVIAYNIAFMGVYVGSEWLWGMQNLPALRLPTSAWITAMNEADRTLSAWDNQKQFTIGGEITVDMEPAAVLDEIASSSAGRFIESAGSYKPRCGAPGTSVWSFGEGQLLITDPRMFTPFPGLEATYNTVEASYSEPAEAWGAKSAPVLSDPAYVAADGNRRLSAGINFPMVSRNEQVQRLAYTYLEDGRRFRVFQASFHPLTWLLEPGDVIAGTILHEGFDGKEFEIIEMQGRRTFVQTMTLREIDPADFDPPSSARQPWSVGPIQTIYPPAQPATGISFAPYEFYDNEARARRLGIEGFYQGGMEDVEFFRVEVRRPGAALPFFDASFAYDAASLGSVSQPFFSPSFLPGMDLEVRGKYAPFSARDTDWSSWLAVTTPDIALSIADLEQDIRDQLGVLEDWIDAEPDLPGAIDAIDDAFDNIKDQVALLESQISDILAAPDWAVDETYPEGALVKWDGGLYRSLDDGNIGNLPSDAGWWEKIGDYASLGEALSALVVRIEQAETQIETVEGGVAVSVNDRRELQAALMAQALLNGEQGDAELEARANQAEATAAVAQESRTEISRLDGVLTAHAEDFTVVRAQIDSLEAGKASVTAFDALSSTVSQQGDTITAHGSALIGVQNVLEGFSGTGAVQTAVFTLEGQVAATQGSLESTQGAVTALQNALTGYTGVSAIANAFTSMGTNISALAGDVASQAVQLLGVEASVGEVSAAGRIKFESVAGGSGGWSRIGLDVRANEGGAWRGAALFLEARTSGAPQTRIILSADQTAIMGSNGTLHAVFGSDGVVNGAYIPVLGVDKLNVDQIFGQNANITGVLQVGSGAQGVFLQGNNNRVLIVDNT